MAIYVPPSRRRRQLLLVAGVALFVGVILGGFAARATAPSVGERVRTTQERARLLVAGLRVVTIHQETDSASLKASVDAGADLAVRRTETGLKAALGMAPWIPGADKAKLLSRVADLRGGPKGEASTPQFAQRVEAAASSIETAFGIRGRI